MAMGYSRPPGLARSSVLNVLVFVVWRFDRGAGFRKPAGREGIRGSYNGRKASRSAQASLAMEGITIAQSGPFGVPGRVAVFSRVAMWSCGRVRDPKMHQRRVVRLLQFG